MTPPLDDTIVTGLSFQQTNASDLLVTPAGGAQKTLAQALAFGANPMPLENRRPNGNDDATRGYVAGDLWRFKKQIWTCLRNTAGHAAWTPLTAGAAPLPGNVSATAPLVIYAPCRLIAGYTGHIVKVQRLSDSTQLDIDALPNGDLDEDTLWKFGAGTVVRVAKAYDQLGSGNDAFQTVFAQMPVLSPFNRVGRHLEMVADMYTTLSATTTAATGSPVSAYLIIPDAVTTTNQALSIVSIHRAGTGGSGQVWQIGNLTSRAFQLIAFGSSGYDFYPGSGAFNKGMYSCNPMVSSFSVASSRVFTGQVGEEAAPSGGNFGATNYGFVGGRLGGNDGASSGGNATFSRVGDTGFGGIVIWSATLSAADMLAARGAMHAVYETVPQARINVVYQSDSIGRGFGQAYCQGQSRRLSDATSSSVRFYNQGRDGQTTAQMLASYDVQIPQMFRANAPLNVFILWASGNGISAGSTDVQEQANITGIIIKAKATGFQQIIVVTGPNRSTWTVGTTPENTRLSVNAWIRANASVLGYVVADVGSDPLIGVTGSAAANQALYFIDGTHPNPLGTEIELSYILPVLLPMLNV